MAASDHLSGMQFGFKKAEPRSMDGPRNHRVEARKDNGDLVGYVQWHHKTREVEHVWVHPAERRQGVATALWDKAKEVSTTTRGVGKPRHSPERTNEGEAWARSLNERLPRLM